MYAFWTATSRGKVEYSAFDGSAWSAPRTVAGSWGHADSAVGPAATTTASGSALYWPGPPSPDRSTTQTSPAPPRLSKRPPRPRSPATLRHRRHRRRAQHPADQLHDRGAAPALGYAGNCANGNLYVAATAKASGKVSYQAIFHMASSDLLPADWTPAEFDPAAKASAGPALTASGYVIDLGWSHQSSSKIDVSSALTPTSASYIGPAIRSGRQLGPAAARCRRRGGRRRRRGRA